MVSYGLRRLLAALPILFGILTLTFFLIHLAPGDPLALYESPDIDPQARDHLQRAYGLDDPLPVQYMKWVWEFCFHWEFGTSFRAHRPVADLLAEALPNTLLLAGVAWMFAFLAGSFLGLIAAVQSRTRLDPLLTVITLALYSLPAFWLAHEFILLFSLGLGWLPSSHMQSVGAADLSWAGRLFDRLNHLFLPALTLAIAPTAGVTRYVRSAVLEVVHQDYIRTARARGITEFLVIGKHTLRNALLPVLTLAGLSLPFLVNGSLIVEVIFAWPGMGRMVYEAVFARDYPVIIATTFVAGCMVILGNLLSDLSYALADPRIRWGRKSDEE